MTLWRSPAGRFVFPDGRACAVSSKALIDLDTMPSGSALELWCQGWRPVKGRKSSPLRFDADGNLLEEASSMP